MPVQVDLDIFKKANVEDVDKYNKLQLYLAKLEANMFYEWQTFNKLWGKVPWKPNQGSRMVGVRGEPTPVSQQTVYPNPITTQPKKHVIETMEVTEDATVKWHKFRSLKMHFLPSFQDFRTGQLDFVHQDMIRQIAVYGDQFISSVMEQKTPAIYIAGADSALVDAPFIPYGTDITATTVAASGKNTAFWEATCAKVKKNLTLRMLDNLVAIMRDDIGAPFFEGAANQPKDNELLKGKFVLIGSSEAYQCLKWDPDFNNMRNVNMNVVNDGFRGSLFDELTWRAPRYPRRLKADGTSPAPEIYIKDENRRIPNPDYVNAPYEVAWLCGSNAFKSINIGPPPSEFTTKNMSQAKFYSMRWNGEVYLTDQVLVEYDKGDGTTGYETNAEGELVQFYSTLVCGAMPVNARNVLPVVFRRVRPGAI